MTIKYITFFHNSDEYRDFFSHNFLKRPTFYWYSDSFHSHTGCIEKEKYFYLFVKDPIADGIALRSRNEGLDFNGLHSHYNDFKKECLKNPKNGEYFYKEPSILMSFSTFEPDLIAEYDNNDNTYCIIKPIQQKGQKFKLYDDKFKEKYVIGEGVPFIDIPEIITAVPKILEALPNIEPRKSLGKYHFDNWLPMVTEKNGSWL